MDDRLPRSFFERHSSLVARDLIGTELRQPAENPTGSEAGVLGGASMDSELRQPAGNPTGSEAGVLSGASVDSELRQPAENPTGSEAGVLAVTTAVQAVILEVEAYCQSDPASHTFNGPTPRNRVMFGPAGHLYTYFTYGMHWCANVVTGHEGEGQAVLLRAARLVAGEPLVRRRRGEMTPERDLLRGPARLAQGFGLDREANGMDLLAPGARLQLHRGRRRPMAIQSGPRVGVRLAADVPWRYYAGDNRYVSAYRRHPKAPAPGSQPKG